MQVYQCCSGVENNKLGKRYLHLFEYSKSSECLYMVLLFLNLYQQHTLKFRGNYILVYTGGRDLLVCKLRIII